MDFMAKLHHADSTLTHSLQSPFKWFEKLKKEKLVWHFMWTASTIGGRDNQQQAHFTLVNRSRRLILLVKNLQLLTFMTDYSEN